MNAPMSASGRLELWGGIECTIARIGDGFRNQAAETGHLDRSADLEAVRRLNIKTLRYPVLWESIAPESLDRPDWSWHDHRLARMRELGIRPIAGLLHHGSGPAYTNLLDPDFPRLFARFARMVAERYPWIEMFTPVNEPLTTARFSGLYGHWYPHHRDERSFLRALVNECLGVVLAMKEVRRVIPAALLVQTEDLGRVFSTPMLRYQADFENERRWLGLDLLCGRVDRAHFFHDQLLAAGIAEDELALLRDEACMPDILGINHYLTSDRYLDQRTGRYGPWSHGGNGRHRYADVEAVRIALPARELGPEARLREAWERYRLPLAVTEAHHGCTREEQLRWLAQVWSVGERLRMQGVDLRAVTIWALFGSMDWNSLLTRRDGYYEPGAFDSRSNPPRPTALAKAASELACTGKFHHAVLGSPGWWQRPERAFPKQRCRPVRARAKDEQAVLITGATGTLGRAFARICELRGLPYQILCRQDMDVADQDSVETALAEREPWAVINAAGYVRVADAEHEQERCFRENSSGAATLAKVCRDARIPYLCFSSDLVFDGSLGRPYVESDPVSPTCVYGASKAEAERRVSELHPGALMIRTSAFFGPWDEHNFVYKILRDLACGRRVEACDETVVSPTYVPDLVHACLDLLIDGSAGVWHLANQGAISWYELARRVARDAEIDATALVRRQADKKAITALSTERGILLPSLESATDRCLRESEFIRRAIGSAGGLRA
jgi:dTDP-4-dehydrorhamnose reductase